MTKCETTATDIIPGFDVLKWKRDVQKRIYHETKDMTTEEFLEYLRRGSEKRRLHRTEKAAKKQA